MELIEKLAEIDEEIEEHFLNEEFDLSADVLKAAIRRNVLSRKFVPVFMGSAYKNKGIQPMLDGVIDYLPNPTEVTNSGVDISKPDEHTKVDFEINEKKPFVGLAFKLEEN